MFNFADLAGMMSKAKEFQEKMEAAKNKLGEITAESEAGGGMVRVKASAANQILNIEIDADVMDKDDPQILEDLVLVAVNKALAKANELGQAYIQKETEGLMPDIPGMPSLGF